MQTKLLRLDPTHKDPNCRHNDTLPPTTEAQQQDPTGKILHVLYADTLPSFLITCYSLSTLFQFQQINLGLFVLGPYYYKYSQLCVQSFSGVPLSASYGL